MYPKCKQYCFQIFNCDAEKALQCMGGSNSWYLLPLCLRNQPAPQRFAIFVVFRHLTDKYYDNRYLSNILLDWTLDTFCFVRGPILLYINIKHLWFIPDIVSVISMQTWNYITVYRQTSVRCITNKAKSIMLSSLNVLLAKYMNK